MTITCNIGEGKYSDWYYIFMRDQQPLHQYSTNQMYFSQYLTTDLGGRYYCRVSHMNTRVTKDSNVVSLTISGELGSAVHLEADVIAIHREIH